MSHHGECFETALPVIRDGSKIFSSYVIDGRRLNKFQEYCEAIDELSDEFGNESIEVEVDTETGEISVSLECIDLTVDIPQKEPNEHILYDLVEKTVKFGFFATEDGTVIAKFVFPSLWMECEGIAV